jgi:calcineurin-like phosphoesterase family protein
MYDIIGDIHGMRKTMDAMLDELGYRLENGRWQAPAGRKAVFLGDLIDRGPDSLGCLETVQAMHRDGVALMILGNHELNALHYMHPEKLREHTEKNTGQFKATLAQIEDAPERWEALAPFLMRCPTKLVLDEGRLRVIHACWDFETVDELPEYIDSDQLLRATAKEGTLNLPVENCIKGPEDPCEKFEDADGNERDHERRTWWDIYPSDEPLVAFGHYWFPWKYRDGSRTPREPTFFGPGKNAVCLDYSVGKGGRLVALRYPERRFVIQHCIDDRTKGVRSSDVGTAPLRDDDHQ